MNRIKANVNVSVLMIFFNRPETFRRVFEQVRKAKPAVLYLYQDGAREGRVDDITKIQECRKIVENIDWECEVHRLYQEKNYGCDPSVYLAIRWFFDHVDRGIILEDDVVPAVNFFRFSQELLDKYADDEQIATISGMNHLKTYRPEDTKADYFFAHASSIWGWATWRRFVDQWDTQYSFLDSNEKIEQMRKNFLESKILKSDRVRFDLFIDKCHKHKNTGAEHFESLVSSTRYLHNQLGIFPCENMISNIGHEGESTHGATSLKLLPKVSQKVFNIPRVELTFPIEHPVCIKASDKYLFKKEKLMTASIWNYPFRWIESKIRYLLYSK